MPIHDAVAVYEPCMLGTMCPLCRLKSRCPNLAESGNDTVAGTNPDRDPEQTPGLLSALITGDKSLATRWAVSVGLFILYV